MMLMQTTSTLFSGTAEEYFKLLGALLVMGSAFGGLIGYWLKKRDDARWERMTGTINGIGARVDTVSDNQKLHEGFFANTREQQLRLQGKLDNAVERLAKQEANMERFTSDIHEHHRELRTIMEKSAREQLEAVHRVELEMAELKGQNNIGDALKEMGRSIERAIRVAVHREET